MLLENADLLNFVGKPYIMLLENADLLNFVGRKCPPSPPSPTPANPLSFRIEPALSASLQAYGERYKLILWHEVWGVWR